MADFPTFDENANRPRSAITVDPEVATDPAVSALVKQQWLDVVSHGLDKQHPLSINRDSAKVTNDPYKES